MIRYYKESDKESIEKLVNSDTTGREGFGYYNQFWKMEYGNDYYNSVYIEEEEGEIWGFITSKWLSLTEGYEIGALFTDNHHRQEWIWTLLINKVIKDAKGRGVKYIQLQVYEDNKSAKKFYEGLWFKKVGFRSFHNKHNGKFIGSYQMAIVFNQEK